MPELLAALDAFFQEHAELVRALYEPSKDKKSSHVSPLWRYPPCGVPDRRDPHTRASPGQVIRLGEYET